MAPIVDCEDFRINIRLEDLEQSDDEFKATLLAKAVGSRDQSSDEWSQSRVGKKVLQVSSVWQTTWARTESEQLELLSVRVPAVEIVALSLNGCLLYTSDAADE